MLTSQAIFNYNSKKKKPYKNNKPITHAAHNLNAWLYLVLDTDGHKLNGRVFHLASCIVTYCGDISLQISFHSHKNQSALTILRTYLMMKFMLFQPEQNLTDSQMNKV